MSGWKTWLGGLVLIAAALVGAAYGFLNDQIVVMLLGAGAAGLGLELIGVGHKIEKSKG